MVFLLMLNCRSKLKGSAILLGDSAKQQSLFTVAESSSPILKQHRLDCFAVSIILKQQEFNAFSVQFNSKYSKLEQLHIYHCNRMSR